MKVYVADTNFYLRLILKDIPKQVQLVKKSLNEAKNGKTKVIFRGEVIIEMEFVLRKVYSLPKEEIINSLLVLVKTPYLDIQNKEVWVKSLISFSKLNIDLLDIFLFEIARSQGAEVLSFDKDMIKLAKIELD